jgi:glycine betaine/proline transport system substrate-binding protein
MNLQRVRRPKLSPSVRRTAQGAVAAAAALVVATACGTGSGSSSANEANLGEWEPPEAVTEALQAEGPITTIDHNISSSSAQAQLYAAVVEAFGGEVEVEYLADYGATFATLSKAENMSVLEMWAGAYADLFKQYVEDEGTVDDFELNDIDKDAAEGWYVPTYVIEGDPDRGIEPMCPGLPDWEALNDCVDVFKSPETGDKGRYVSGAKSWGPAYGDPQRIENLGLDYEVTYAGSEAALQAEWVRAVEQGEPLLALMWSPHFLTSKYDLTKVEFPPYYEGCWGEGGKFDCDWGPLDVKKLTSAGYRENYPAAAQILDNYNLTADQLGEMMVEMVDEGKKAEEVVAEWMEENPSVWQAWGEGADK